VEALAGVDLTVEAGEMVAIVGPSGSGKSTLLHIMGALDRPTGGEVEIEGRSLASMTDAEMSGLRAHRLGFVFQEFFLIHGVPAWQNVAQGLMYRGVASAQRRRAARLVLERVGLGHRLEHLPTQLSGGEKQRVAIARALVGEPAVVFADEATGNLDSVSASGIVDLLLELNLTGSTIVVITHDHSVAERFPRRVSLLDGRLVA
jgi:putative ABC transport system ATP-binding protein